MISQEETIKTMLGLKNNIKIDFKNIVKNIIENLNTDKKDKNETSKNYNK